MATPSPAPGPSPAPKTTSSSPTLESLNSIIKGLQESITKLQNDALTAKTVDTNTTTTSTSDSSLSPTPAPLPKTTEPNNPENINSSVKIATSNLFVDQQPLAVDGLANLLFQDFPVTELVTNTLNFSLINGGTDTNVISNIDSTLDSISSYSLSSVPNIANLSSFNLSKYKALDGSGASPNKATVYIEPANKNIVIEVTNINNKELVEYQIIYQGTIVNGTI
jgi:hypothetical protein